MPPGLHQSLISEKEIQTLKAHLIEGLSSCDPNSPIHLWYRLIRQSDLTLNLLRPACMNPFLSADVYLNGDFDFNRTPLALPGIRVIMFEVPTKICTFAQHGVEGWHLGPSPEHYRCYTVYFPATNVERIVKTVDFSPHNLPVPKHSSTDAAHQALKTWRRH